MRGKAEEADNRRSQRYILMGEGNAEIVRKAESWCTHIRQTEFSGSITPGCLRH